MKASLRILWMIALLIFTVGCSGYRVKKYSLAKVAPENQPEPGSPTLVFPGDRIRINLQIGDSVEGKVELISKYEIVLEPEGDSLQPRGYFADQIESVEFVHTEYSTAQRITVGVGVLLLFGGILLAVLSSQVSVMGN